MDWNLIVGIVVAWPAVGLILALLYVSVSSRRAERRGEAFDLDEVKQEAKVLVFAWPLLLAFVLFIFLFFWDLLVHDWDTVAQRFDRLS
ncbi:hypothetical protein AMJ57_02385 [Parcubacteria bacterium SG8_24]|nr:MAG: hypothetical protein AMJ57_02385 [Parcubacteria bacterium SG8_24]